MRNATRDRMKMGTIFILIGLIIWPVFNRPAEAQNQELQQRVAELKQGAAKNKMALAQYTWMQQVSIILKGEQKKQEHFQVRIGPDGTQQKTSLDPQEAAPPSGGRLKQHVVAKKKEEYTDYADSMKALAQQYVPPTQELLQQAYVGGNITLGTVAGNPSEAQFVIHNYLKPQDTMTLIYDRAQKVLIGLTIATYMDDPKDAMNLSVQFTRLPDGSNQVSGLTLNGVSKQLTIVIANSNYQHL